ncbi:MAG: T9SS type A sorting domain-containing protein [Flavobacteriales bacterium]
MVRTLLVTAALTFVTGASAQCTPDPLYRDSLFGVWPDTLENFASGIVQVPYSDTLNIIVPGDAGVINSSFSGVMLDSVVFNRIVGLPPGISVQCNSQTAGACTLLPGHLGCGLIAGTPTQAGTYPLTINVTAYTTFLGNVLPVPYSFRGYVITIAADPTGIGEMVPVTLGQVQNVPNPFGQRTSIEFFLSSASLAKVKVFNLVGEELWKETVQGKSGMNRVPFDGSRLESGIYLYKVEAGARTFTGRMVVNRSIHVLDTFGKAPGPGLFRIRPRPCCSR